MYILSFENENVSSSLLSSCVRAMNEALWLRCNLVRNWTSSRFDFPCTSVQNAFPCCFQLWHFPVSSIAIEIILHNHYHKHSCFLLWPHELYVVVTYEPNTAPGHPLYASLYSLVHYSICMYVRYSMRVSWIILVMLTHCCFVLNLLYRCWFFLLCVMNSCMCMCVQFQR